MRPRFSTGSLRATFVVGIGLTLVPIMLVAATATIALQRSLAAIHEVVEEASEELTVLLRLQVLLERETAAIHSCLSRGAGGRASCGFRDSRQIVDAAFRGAATAPFALEEERALLHSAWEQWQRAGDIGESVLATSDAETVLSREIAALDAHLDRAVAMLERAHSLSEWEMAASLVSVRSVRRRTSFLILAVLVLALLISSAGGVLLARSILNPVNVLERGAERLAAGDLAHRVSLAMPAELARLGSTFNAMAETLATNQASLVEESVRVKEAAARAAEASRLKDEFLASLSHELRTPLTVVLGYARIMRQQFHKWQVRGADGSEAQRILAVIERSGAAQLRLIEDLLDVQRIISGKFRMETAPFDLQQLGNTVVDSLRPVAEAKRLQWRTRIEAIEMHADAARIQQVLWNLLSNAIKFTPEHGCLDLHAYRVDHSVVIKVEDSGEGIPADFLPHVFERFRQLDMSTTRRHCGMGLGLSIVKEVVERHGGTVTAHSAGEGKGSTFVVTLPLFARMTPAARDVAAGTQASSG